MGSLEEVAIYDEDKQYDHTVTNTGNWSNAHPLVGFLYNVISFNSMDMAVEALYILMDMASVIV